MPLSAPQPLQRIGRFATIYGRLLREHLVGKKIALSVVLVLSFIGGVGQGAIPAFIGICISNVQKYASSGNALPLLIGSAAAILALTAVSNWATYNAARHSRQIGRRVQIDSSIQTIGTLSRTSSLHGHVPGTIGEMIRLVLRDGVHAGLAVEAFIRAAEPILRFASAAGVLVWIDVKLSLLTIPMLLALLPMLYMLVGGVNRDSRSYFETRSVRMWERVSGLVMTIDATGISRDVDTEARVKRLLDEPELRRYFDEYDRINLASHRVQFGVSLATSLFLASGLLLSGYLASTGRLQWPEAMAYLLAIWTSMNAVRAVIGTLTQLGMYYPACRRLEEFHAPPQDLSTEAALRWPILVRATGQLPEASDEVRLHPGDRVAVNTDADIGRIGLKAVLQPILPGIGDPALLSRRITFFGNRAALIDIPLRHWVARDAMPPEQRDRLESVLASAGVAEEFAGLAGGWDHVLDEPAWKTLDPALRLALLAAAARADPAPICIFAQPIVNGLPADTLEVILTLLEDKLVLCVGAGLGVPRPFGEAVIVIRQGEVLGVGNLAWLTRVHGKLKKTTATAMPAGLEGLA